MQDLREILEALRKLQEERKRYPNLDRAMMESLERIEPDKAESIDEFEDYFYREQLREIEKQTKRG